MTEPPTHTPLPCPICGDEPLVRYRGGAWGVNCAGSAPSHLVWTYGGTEAEAIATWNTRADSHHRFVEALRYLLDEVGKSACADTILDSAAAGKAFAIIAEMEGRRG